MSSPASSQPEESDLGAFVEFRDGDVGVTGTDQRAPTDVDRDGEASERWSLDSLCRLALTVLIGEGVSAGRLDLHLADPDTMAELKAEYFGEDAPTDVLAFPLDDPFGEEDPFGEDDSLAAEDAFAADGPGPGEAVLGDVLLCPVVARRQAAGDAGGDPTPERFEAEMNLLCVHGVLHVLGHDHAESEESDAMQARERHYLGPRP